jgi:hypothetical protein
MVWQLKQESIFDVDFLETEFLFDLLPELAILDMPESDGLPMSGKSLPQSPISFSSEDPEDVSSGNFPSTGMGLSATDPTTTTASE